MQGETMANNDSHVTIHMAASLDGFIARKDGSVDWLETSDEFVGGETMDPGFVEAFLKTIDCYVRGSRTYEIATKGGSKQLKAEEESWDRLSLAIAKVRKAV
jgi:dihydrofolate reductase